MTLEQLSLLAADIETANEYAEQFKDTPDGGPSNFDQPAVKLRTTVKFLREHGMAVTRASKVFAPWACRTEGGTWFLLGRMARTDGQGTRNTKMAQAIARKLKELGWEARVFYQLD